MKIKETETYPIRYVAFNNPGIIWINKNPIRRVGIEYAVFTELEINKYDRGLIDGIYIEIHWHSSGLYQLEVCATVPNQSRKQFVYNELINEWDNALELMLKKVTEARQFIKNGGQ